MPDIPHTAKTKTAAPGFRDQLTTVDEKGKRIWVFAKKITGKWFKRRAWVGYSLLVFLLAAPFIHIGGHPLLQFDLLHRKFVLFGSVFWPHDFYLFLLGLLSVIIGIFLFTSVFGRIWCGWACPQTIFMEFLFRRIEYLFEGDAPAQRKLDKEPWNDQKILRRGGKLAAFYLVSFIIANVFLAYIIGSDELLKIATESPSKHIGGLIGIVGFSGVFFFVFTYMREQVCTVICPYGRLQSVLVDDQTLVVAYDYKRGEPRDKWGRNRAADAGDCINCRQCVDVCPTGIDIRNGIQLECVNCNLCIDACNSVMSKINKQPDLIKMASMQGIEKGEPFKMNTRRILYTVLLCVVVGAFITLLSLRSDVQATLLRIPGSSFIEMPGGQVRNVYNFKILNKTFDDMPVEFRLENIKGAISLGNKNLVAPGEGYGEGILSLEIDRILLKGASTPVKVGLYSKGEKIQTVSTNFLGPQL